MKIIYIITFSPKYAYADGTSPDHYWRNSNNEIIGVWRTDRGHVFAKEVKRFFPNVEYEVWRPDFRAEKEYVHIFEDGVKHRSFPGQTINARYGIKRTEFCTSNELIEKLGLYILENQRKNSLICHIPLDFSYLGHIILKMYGGLLPFLHTSHLNPQLLKPKIRTLHPIKLLHRIFIGKKYKKHLQLLKEIAVSPDRLDFFKVNTKANVYQLNSLNFDLDWAKNKISKHASRKNLKLDFETYILFSSSRLVPEKQIDKMIISLSEIKDLNFKCIISGSGEEHYLSYLKKLTIDLGLESKISFVGFVSQKLIDYYCASDIFISTSISEAGPVSAIRAMALNIPIVSTNTGIASYLLKTYNAGVIIDNKDTSLWGKKIERAINGERIETVNINRLKEEFDLKKSIFELVSYYKIANENFLEYR